MSISVDKLWSITLARFMLLKTTKLNILNLDSFICIVLMFLWLH